MLANLPLSGDSLVSLLLLLLMFSVFVNLFFINGKVLDRFRARSIAKQAPSIIKKFLGEQAHKTTDNHRFHYIPELHDIVVKFRSAYLKIEEKSIDREIDSPEYWNLLNGKLNALFKLVANYSGSKALADIKKRLRMIKTLVAESERAIDKNKIYKTLDRFYRACKLCSDDKKLAEFDKKLNKIILRLSDKHYAKLERLTRINEAYADNAVDAIDSMGESIAAVEASAENMPSVNSDVATGIEKCRDNADDIKQGFSRYRESIDRLEAKIHVLKNQDDELESSDEARASTESLLALSEQIQEENEREISRLSTLVIDQKSTIGDLKKQLDEAAEKAEIEGQEGDESASAENSALLESLSNNLRDAEHCISVLEKEIEILQEKSARAESEFTSQGLSGAPSVSESDLASLNDEMEGLQKDLESQSAEMSLLSVVAQFAEEVFQGETFEDLSLLLYETLKEMGTDTVLKVYGPSRTFEVCDSGKIPKRLLTIIDNLHINETSSTPNSVFFKYNNIAGAIKPINSGPFTQEKISHILAVNAIANKMLDKLRLINAGKLHVHALDVCENNIKKTSAGVDSAFDEIAGQAVSAVNDSFQELQHFGRSSGMSASQLAHLKTIEENALAEINSKKSTRLKVKKSFLELLREIESIR